MIVDVGQKCEQDRDYSITVQDLLDWENEHGQSLNGQIVLLKTGFAKHWPNRERYMGTEELGPSSIAKLRFPGLGSEAARWLANERKIKAIGIDTPSIDPGQTKTFGAHVALLGQNIPVFENVADMSSLPAFGFEVFALPMKIKDGSGAPLRIIARVAK